MHRKGRVSGAADPVRRPRAPLRALLLASLCLAGQPAAADDLEALTGPPESVAARAAAILSRAIRLRTVNPPGAERPLAEYFVALMRRAGLEARLVPTPAGPGGAARAAAWGRLRGRGAGRPLILLSHLDTVPADPEGWQVDPFAGAQREGQIIGRGALDAKGVAVVQLLTLATLAQRPRPPARDLIFLATPDEESGGGAGAGYLVREHPELLGGAGYLLTEGGGVLLRSDDRRGLWGVAITEKSPCWLRLAARGSGGHSSVPPLDAAVPRLIAALERVRRIDMPLRVLPEVARMFAAMAPLAPPEMAAGFADLERTLDEDAGFRQRFLARREQAALVRDTLSITVLEGSARTNVLALEAAAHLDARLLPGGGCEAFADSIRRAVADPGVTLETLLAFPSRSSPPDTPLFEAIRRVAARVDPGAVVVPRVNAGFTDAHYFRDLGITAYGFVPRWLEAEEARRIHGVDERISVENLARGVETLVAILDELDRIEPKP